MSHSIQLVHLSGLLHRRATCCIDTSESRSGNAESRFHRVPLAEASTSSTFEALRLPPSQCGPHCRVLEDFGGLETKLAINSPSKLACFGALLGSIMRGKAR